MSLSPAERCFDKGLAALADGRPLEAVDCFLEAMQIEHRRQIGRPDMRHLSYYGLSLARAQRAPHAALEACTLAVRDEPTRSVLYLNLGRVHQLAGRRSAALACFEHGLRLAPADPELRREVERMERRSEPCLRFLRREHPLNRWLGRWRAARRRRGASAGPAAEALPFMTS
jgi:tetratricopeptide (TPR) repeat protein